jgi:hypothetical protein
VNEPIILSPWPAVKFKGAEYELQNVPKFPPAAENSARFIVTLIENRVRCVVKAVVVLVVASWDDDATVVRKGIITRRSIADIFIRENIKLQTVKTTSKRVFYDTRLNWLLYQNEYHDARAHTPMDSFLRHVCDTM